MFFFFPFSTDAPIYYWPFATVTLIAVNILVFCAMVTGVIEDPNTWMLGYGHGLHGEQWLTSMFTHGGFEHLFGNMLFLWVFGIVVEGKLGWWKFLACYLGIGTSHAVLEQLIMLGYDGEVPGSIGASAAIFGLMAMATVWAPKNEITFFYLLVFRTGTFDVAILALATLYTCMEIITVMFFGGGAGSSLLHLSGFAIGLPLGIFLLKTGVVDCEGWDFFHVWRGDYGTFKSEPAPAKIAPQPDSLKQHREEQHLVGARQQFGTYLKQKNLAAALRLYEKMKHIGGGWTLDRNELIAVTQAMHTEKRWRDSAPYMAEVIQRFSESADPMRVKLAQICVVELDRPGKALELLADVDSTRLPDQLATLAKRIAAKAHHMQQEGVVEFDTDEW